MEARGLSRTWLLRAGRILTAAVAFGVAFWKPVDYQENLHIRQITGVLARDVASDLSEELESQMQTQVRLSKLLTGEDAASRLEWEPQAKLFLADHPEFLAIQWLDTDYHVRWSVTNTISDIHDSPPLAIVPPERQMLEGLAHRGKTDVAVLTTAFRIENGRSLRRIVVPVYRRGSFLGFMISVFDEGKAFADILSDHARLGYSMVVLEGPQEILKIGPSGPENEKKWAQDVELALPGRTSRIRVWPTADLVRKIRSPLPMIGLILGPLFGLLLFMTLDFARTSRCAAQAFQDSQERLREIISSAMDAVVSVNEDQRIVVFNKAAEKIFRCPASEAFGQSLDRFIPERFREAHQVDVQNFGRTGISYRSMASPPTLWGLRADGEEFPVEASISQTRTSLEKLYTVILRDVTERHRAAEELRQAHEELESRVEQRTAELQSANTQLQDEIRERRQAEESLRDLSGHLLRLRDEERRRLARELHDSTAQILGALVIGLERVVQVVSANDTLKAQELLTQSCELAEKATAEVRTLSYLLHPPMLDDLGLEGVLPWYADGFSKRSGIRVSVNVQPGLGRFTRETELTLFRVVQEALTNIHRHSGSPTGEIAVSKDAHGVKLCVTDRGRGIPPDILESARLGRAMMGVGIAGMGERVRHLNGRLEIESRGYGTSIKVMLPIDAMASQVQANGPDFNVLRTS